MCPVCKGYLTPIHHCAMYTIHGFWGMGARHFPYFGMFDLGNTFLIENGLVWTETSFI